jgi:HSP20 family protein
MKNWNWTKNDDQNTSRNIPNTTQSMSNLPAASYFGPLSGFYQEMDRMFDQAFRNFGLPSVFSGNTALFNPSVDISSTDKEYTIEVEAPGLKEEDVRIDLTRDRQLCICGEKRQENEKQEKDFHRVERAYGTFSRTLSLPQDADQDNIEADFNNGVLTITIPRLESEDSKARRIEVGSGERGKQRGRQDTPRQDNTANSNPKRAA